ncbi:MAG TPA: type 4a pilus biogenesis protein PilO [Gammaproteobacteria bacterium]|nr:type 4a pilus biogenesis protein PilO [Gammaproteobacteria bacterium]
MNLRDLNNIDLGDLIQDLRNLDFNDIGSWSGFARGFVIALCCLVIAFLGYYMVIRGELNDLHGAQAKEQQLRQTFEAKQRRVANLDAYEKQLKEMRASFGSMLRQLPSQTEIADLLQDISQTRVATGLQEELFKPLAERPKEFYAEVPIKIRVTGTFHEMAKFASGIAGLPRIVTLNGISLRKKKKDQPDQLVMNATAMTYRYIGKNGKKKGGRHK